MGFNWNMLLPQWEIMHQKRWSGKVAFRSRKVAVWSGKSRPLRLFSFEGYKLLEKDMVNSSKTQFKAFVFPFLQERSK